MCSLFWFVVVLDDFFCGRHVNCFLRLFDLNLLKVRCLVRQVNFASAENESVDKQTKGGKRHRQAFKKETGAGMEVCVLVA